MKSKKTILSHYPNFFLFQLVIRSLTWFIFFLVLATAGTNYLETDILGNIVHSISGKEINFKQYFIGSNLKEKTTFLKYASYFIWIIIFLNILSLLYNLYLWKKDRYISNNNFYLHNLPVFIINTLTHITSAFLLTFSFVSAFTVICSLVFITIDTYQLPLYKKKKNPQLENIFSWKNPYVRNILLYSGLVILIFPFIFGRLQTLLEKSKSDAPEGLAKAFKELLVSTPTLKGFLELVVGENADFQFFHWFILILFIRSLITGQSKGFSDFWLQVNGIQKKVIDFKHYYHYQKNWATANNCTINLGDYDYLKNSPQFLGKEYLESDLDINDFARQNQKVIHYIEFYESKIKETNKKNFLHYCLFNEFDSEQDCLSTRKLIEKNI